MFAIVNGKVIFDNEIREKVILVEGQRITAITDKAPKDVPLIDACGLYVSPGFINVHIHGYNGCDVMNGSFETLNTISASLINTGVTGFLATTVTHTVENTISAVNNVGDSIDKVKGAKILGIHLEGPFINTKKKGAHDKKYILSPSIETFKKLCGKYEDIIRIVTLAPELDGARELTEYLVRSGIIVSIGHTDSTYNEAWEGIQSGMSHATHTFNAMRGMEHREPGTVGAILDSSDVTAEFIPDGIHVHYSALRTLLKVKGTEKSVMITDSICAAGLNEGVFELGGLKVYVKNKEARLANGTLAGSTLGMNKGVYNTVKHLNIPLVEAVKTASKIPSRLIGASGIGEIRVGNYADIIFFNDEIDIKSTFVNGVKVL